MFGFVVFPLTDSASSSHQRRKCSLLSCASLLCHVVVHITSVLLWSPPSLSTRFVPSRFSNVLSIVAWLIYGYLRSYSAVWFWIVVSAQLTSAWVLRSPAEPFRASIDILHQSLSLQTWLWKALTSPFHIKRRNFLARIFAEYRRPSWSTCSYWPYFFFLFILLLIRCAQSCLNYLHSLFSLLLANNALKQCMTLCIVCLLIGRVRYRATDPTSGLTPTTSPPSEQRPSSKIRSKNAKA